MFIQTSFTTKQNWFVNNGADNTPAVNKIAIHNGKNNEV